VPWDIGNYWKKDGQPTEVAEALVRCNMPVLAYIAGKPAAFTSKDHNFWPGETVEKQLVVINSSRERVSGATLSLDPGQQTRLPLRSTAGVPGRHEVSAEFGAIKDSFPIDVMPRLLPFQMKGRVAVFDPTGNWKGAGTRVDAAANLARFDTLIVGKGA